MSSSVIGAPDVVWPQVPSSVRRDDEPLVRVVAKVEVDTAGVPAVWLYLGPTAARGARLVVF